LNRFNLDIKDTRPINVLLEGLYGLTPT